MIHSDIFLEKGNSHQVCEDYIIHGDDPFQYIILADGCSSSDNTEMGARILCHLTKQFLRYYQGEFPINADRLGSWVIHNAEMTARQLGLNLSCLDATLIVSYYDIDSREIHTIMFGDGCLVINEKETMTVLSISYMNNAPYYLTYNIADDKRMLYEDLAISKTLSRVDTSGTNIREGTFTYSPSEFFHIVNDDFVSLLMASDGLESFMEVNLSTPKMMSAMMIANDLLAFKNTKGEYLKRRAKKQMKVYTRGSINHFDDLSVGVFLKGG